MRFGVPPSAGAKSPVTGITSPMPRFSPLEMRFRITEQPDGRIKLGLDRSDLERLWEEVNSKRLHTHVAS